MTENRISGIGERHEIILVNKKKKRKNKKDNRERITNVPGYGLQQMGGKTDIQEKYVP